MLADASGIAKTAYGLVNDDFSPVDFVDFANIIEHGILAGIILVRGSTSVPDAMLSPIKLLIQEGAIRLAQNRAPVSPVPNQALPLIGLKERLFNARRNKAIDARFEAGCVAGAELALGRPDFPRALQR